MDTCHKLAKLFLGGVLGKPPSAPNGVKVVERCDGLEVRWASGAPTSRYNSDVYVVELAPRSPKVVEALGPAFSGFAEFHRGSETKFSFDKLGSEQEFAVRVRCGNAAGASRWVEVSARTRQVPTKCGGTGPDGVYTWDQTPTEVEVTVPAPPDTTPRQVSVTVKPRRLEISFAGVVAVAGALGGEVVCGEDGDFEWELREHEDGGGKELFITMEKRVRDVVSYDPAEQWDCLVAEDGHPRIDTAALRWFRGYEWRPPQDASNVDEVKQAMPDMRFTDADQTKMSGRDGELDDWGDKWNKNKR